MSDSEYVKRLEEINKKLEEENILLVETAKYNQELKIALTVSLFHLHGVLHNLELYRSHSGDAQITPDPVESENNVWDKFYDKLEIIANCPISQQDALKSRLYSTFAEIVRKRYG